MIGSLLLLALAQAAPPPTTEDGGRIVMLCDPRRYRFSVRATDIAQAGDDGYPQRIVIDPATLMEGLPGYTNEIDIMGPLIRYVRCGPYTVKLMGDAYNSNVQGESGADPSFASVRVIRGNGTAYPWDGGGEVRLTECDRELPRARPCPSGYAVRIDGAYDAGRKSLVLSEWTTSFLGDPTTGRQERRRSHAEDDDLTLWQPD